MTRPNIEVVPERDFAGTVADELVASIDEILQEQESCSVCLSGGTSPASVLRLLGLPPRVRDVEWGKIKFFWGDERWLPQDDPGSNYRMVNDTLLQQLRDHSPVIEAVNTSLPSSEKGAEDYAERIRAQGHYDPGVTDNPFDIVMLGVGEDGHFASVFPEAPIPEGKLCYETVNPSDNTKRVTIAPEALLAGKRLYVLVKGESKTDIVDRLLADDLNGEGEAATGDSTKLPALLIEQRAENVLWFLDRKAAKNLPQEASPGDEGLEA